MLSAERLDGVRMRYERVLWSVGLGAFLLLQMSAVPAVAASAARAPVVSVGAQYDSTHVYVAPSDLDGFVKSFTATFGGTFSKPSVTNVLPVPSSATFQYIMTPAGTLSVFAFQTPIPFPFGSERTGYLVGDMDAAIKAARASGAEIIVAPFRDPIGRDCVIQWPGGVKMQLYWHFTAPNYPPLVTVPENRIYVSPDSANAFIRDFLRFAKGKIVSDERKADAGEIGRAGAFFRRVHIESGFGAMLVLVTDGHLPYPFGREVSGYQVDDLDATLTRAKAAGATVLSPSFTAPDRTTAILQFPGGYIAEVHAVRR
jgi:predicted enzyme related to lactoylglutathione lyase